MKNLIATVERFSPACAQETADRAVMLDRLKNGRDVLLRTNLLCHFTASSWIVNRDASLVLMVFHNIYGAWSWTGGHADGESDLLRVALREATEETGICGLTCVGTDPISLETLAVNPHVRRGVFVPAHLHMNLTYLLIADHAAPVSIKPDENSAIRWMTPTDAAENCAERWMRPVYRKLNARMRARI